LFVCDIYLHSDGLEKAQEHCQTALQLAEEMDATNALMMVFYSQGEIAQGQGKLDEAREYFTRCLDLAENLGVGYGIAEATRKLQELS
jgi:tetratricopeptide (TPR) repeat protein